MIRFIGFVMFILWTADCVRAALAAHSIPEAAFDGFAAGLTFCASAACILAKVGR